MCVIVCVCVRAHTCALVGKGLVAAGSQWNFLPITSSFRLSCVKTGPSLVAASRWAFTCSSGYAGDSKGVLYRERGYGSVESDEGLTESHGSHIKDFPSIPFSWKGTAAKLRSGLGPCVETRASLGLLRFYFRRADGNGVVVGACGGSLETTSPLRNFMPLRPFSVRGAGGLRGRFLLELAGKFAGTNLKQCKVGGSPPQLMGHSEGDRRGAEGLIGRGGPKERVRG
jgi:hypothetical protein